MLTRNAFTSDHYPPDVIPEVIFANAGQTPVLAAVLAAQPERATREQTFKWHTRDTAPRRTQINHAPDNYDGTTTALVVDDASVFQVKSVVYAEATGERMLVTAVNSGSNTITVTRGIGSANGAPAGAAGSVADDAWLINIGIAAGEGSTTVPNNNNTGSFATNYTQIFRRGIQVSGTVHRSAGNLTPEELAIQRLQSWNEFQRDLDDALIFGSPSLGSVGADGLPTSTTGGAFHYISQVYNIAGNLTRAKISEIARTVALNGSENKVLVGGPTFVGYVESLFEGKVQYTPSDNLVGLNVMRIQGSGGASTLRLVQAPRWKGIFAAQAMIVDLAEVTWRPLSGGGRTTEQGGVYGDGRMQLGQGREAKGRDAIMEEWFAEGGFDFGNLAAHARLTGITGIA